MGFVDVHFKGRRTARATGMVVASVIVTAVALTAAIVYAFWASGAVYAATKFEKIEVGAYVARSNESWSVTIAVLVRNLGEVDTLIDDIFLNGKPICANGAYDFHPKNPAEDPIPILAGESLQISFRLPESEYKSGMLVMLAVHTSTNQLHSTPLFLE